MWEGLGFGHAARQLSELESDTRSLGVPLFWVKQE